MFYRQLTFLVSFATASRNLYADGLNGLNQFDHSMIGSMGMFGWFGMLLFWGVLFFVAVLIVRSLLPGNSKQKNSSAMELLNERFARGEIDAEEFAKRKLLLSESKSQ